jgi:hypothetical protein
LDALKRYTPQSSSQEFRTFLDELDEAGQVEAEGKNKDWLSVALRSSDTERQSRAYSIQRAADAREKISYRRRASEAATNHGVRIWNGKSADAPESPIEKDFTTPGGTPGRLYCPFVSPNKRSSLASVPMTNGNGINGHRTPRGSSVSRGSVSGRRSKRSSFHDPIRAEICGFDDPASAAPSVEGSAPLCPIRFLDQHSPEEVAQYFEKHKHELPRSHETCVKRYQSNEESIKELDAKYGSLVTMIQGLGQVHQPMLPETPDDEGEEDDAGPDPQDRVEKWATTVAGSLQGANAPPDRFEDTVNTEEKEDRLPHFDRPLKDVRVGESPSRPWGITVPDVMANGYDAQSDHTASPRETPVPQEAESPPKGKCPFDHKTMAAMKMGGGAMPGMPGLPMPNLMPPKKMPEEPSSMQADAGHALPPSLPPPAPTPTQFQSTEPPVAKSQPAQIVFNGPVFFGYNMEQAMATLQQLNLTRPAGS